MMEIDTPKSMGLARIDQTNYLQSRKDPLVGRSV